MSIVLMDSCDLAETQTEINQLGWQTNQNQEYFTASVGSGRFGGNAYQCSSSVNLLLVKPFIKYTTLSCWIRFEVIAMTRYVCGVDDSVFNQSVPNASYTQAHISVNIDGSLGLHGDFILRASTPPGTIQPATWHHVEFQVEVGAAGSGYLYVDGILVASAVGVDFLDGVVNASPTFYGSTDTLLDDLVVQQSEVSMPPILGEHKIHTLLPSADTAQADFTGTYADIDDPVGSHDGDATYISATTLNSKSEFELSNLTESPSVVHAVQNGISARKTDAGTKGVTNYIDSNGTEAQGVEFPASETYGPHSDIYELNPDGATAWTPSSVNALKVGVEITT